MTLSRRDRAAMTLALECLRGHIAVDDDEGVCAEIASMRIRDATVALGCASAWGDAAQFREYARWAYRRTPWRLLRARLAIALRTLLRIDACGEDWMTPGAQECVACGSTDYQAAWFTDDGRARCLDCGGRVVEWRIAGLPLWCQAPAHEVAR